MKDALQRLSSSVQGLVEIHPRRGTFVSQISPVDVQETFEVREALALRGSHAGTLHEQLESEHGLFQRYPHIAKRIGFHARTMRLRVGALARAAPESPQTIAMTAKRATVRLGF